VVHPASLCAKFWRESPRFRKVFALREVDASERADVEKLANSRKAEARLVERAAIVWRGLQGQPTGAIAAELKLDRRTVHHWLARFDAGGLDALEDAPRRGRPATYSPEERAEVVATALRRPQELNLPFGCWSLDRLTTYLHEHKQIAIQRSRVGEILLEEGLRWRKQETWFGTERLDPDFAKKKRRPSSGSTPRRRPAAWCSVSTRWAPSPPRATRASNRCEPPPVRTNPPDAPDKKLITAGAARVTCSGPLNPGTVALLRCPTRDAPRLTGWTSCKRSING
jgi:transposase